MPGHGRKRGRRPRERREGAASRDKAWAAALRKGEEHARFVLERRRQRRARRAVAVTRALLVAEGDSWFDYPFFDVLAELEDAHNYTVESVAHRGDSLEEMVYDPNQLEKLARKLEKLHEDRRTPLAILLSGGGNDIAGEEFAVLLNHKASGLPALNAQVVAGLIEDRLRTALIELSSAVTHLCEQTFGSKLPILIHGYDYPVPDGRGYFGGFWALPGPWLEPGFRRKGYGDRAECRDVMEVLIDRWNALLEGIAGGPGLEHLRYVNLRGTLSNDLEKGAYKKWWDNELHPTERGFRSVADGFHRVLSTL